jgi:hypothetical protein
MTPRRSRVVVLLLVCALASACATTSGLKRVALAAEGIAQGLETLQLTADALEASGSITKAQRDALSPYIIQLAQADKALALAVVSNDAGTVRGQIVAMLGVLDQAVATTKAWTPETRAKIALALEVVRATLLVVSVGVTS